MSSLEVCSTTCWRTLLGLPWVCHSEVARLSQLLLSDSQATKMSAVHIICANMLRPHAAVQYLFCNESIIVHKPYNNAHTVTHALLPWRSSK